MRIIEEQVTLRKIQPTTEGNWLCKDMDEGYTFSQMVYLGKDDDGSNWREITEAEKIELEEGVIQ